MTRTRQQVTSGRQDAHREAEEAREPTDRRERKPLSGFRLKLDAPSREGYQRRWINDTGNRLREAQEGGWTFVNDETALTASHTDTADTRVSVIAGRHEAGGVMHAYLMEIPQEWYDEDQAAKEQELDEIDEALRRGRVQGADPRDAEAFSNTSQGRGIVIEH